MRIGEAKPYTSPSRAGRTAVVLVSRTGRASRVCESHDVAGHLFGRVAGPVR